MFYTKQLVISLFKDLQGKEMDKERKAKVFKGYLNLLGFWMLVSKLESNVNYRHLERAIIICHSW